MAWGDLTEDEWALVGALLSAEHGRWPLPALDNRRFLNGMFYVPPVRRRLFNGIETKVPTCPNSLMSTLGRGR